MQASEILAQAVTQIVERRQTPRILILSPALSAALEAEETSTERGQHPLTTIWTRFQRTVLEALPPTEFWIVTRERGQPVVFEVTVPYETCEQVLAHW